MSDFPPDTMGYECQRIDSEMARIAADARRDRPIRGRIAGWLIDRQRREFRRQMDARLSEGLRRAIEAQNADPSLSTGDS